MSLYVKRGASEGGIDLVFMFVSLHCDTFILDISVIMRTMDFL